MIQKVIDKIPAQLMPFIDTVMGQETLEGLYELENRITKVMSNTHVIVINGESWPFHKLAIQEYQRNLQKRIEFVINWKKGRVVQYSHQPIQLRLLNYIC